MATRLEAFANPLKNLFRLPRGWDIRLSPRFIAYTPTYDIDIETKLYRLETAATMSDLLEVFELRHKIFLEETGAASVDSDGYDLDEFDSICDHIIIRCKETDKIVGTYRVISSVYSDNFYSQSEFNLDDFLNTAGHKLELGRACIHHAHRNGAVIDLLWRGIAEYIQLTGSRFLFGCSSLKITDPAEAKAVMSYLKENDNAGETYNIAPIGKFNMNLKDVYPATMAADTVKGLIPPLLRSYFSAGSKVFGEPALDREFKCIDFLTVLDMENLTSGYKRRYFKKS
jgi:putative hemolysin